MAPRGKIREPHIVVTEFDGTTTRFLLRDRTPIGRGPITGQGQVTTVGEADKRGDTRTPMVIWTDQTGGMGVWQYKEMEGVTGFHDSQCDLRYGVITVPPPATQLGASLGIQRVRPTYVEAPGLTAAEAIVWIPLNSAGVAATRYDSGGAAWNTLQAAAVNLVNLSGYATFRGYYLFANMGGTIGIYYSTNATSWTAGTRAKANYGLCVHDNKVYTFNATDNTLDWHTDPTSATGWASSSVLYLYPGEIVRQLVEWQREGRAAVFVLTTQRLLWYDEDADTFHEFFLFRDKVTAVATDIWPRAEVWGKDGNLYLVFFDASGTNIPDTVYWFSGTTNTASPNRIGALPATGTVALVNLSSSGHWLYAFGYPRGNGALNGRILAMNDRGGFTPIYAPATGGSNRIVYGGAYARGNLYAVTYSDTTPECFKIPVPDNLDNPLFAARTYSTAASYEHVFAFTDLGTENMPITALWVEIAARDMTTTYKSAGMAANCSGTVYYQRDTDTAWTSLGSFSSSDAYPVRFSFRLGYGLIANEIRIRLVLATSNSARSPVITAVSLAALREEAVRDAYQCVIDLSDLEHPAYANKSRAQLLAVLERIRQPGVLVKLQFAGGDAATAPSKGRTITSCKVEWSAQEDAETGPGIYSFRATDYTTPTFTALIAGQPAT